MMNTNAEMLARERDLEERAIGLGAARYYLALNGDEEREGRGDAAMPPGMLLMKKMIPDLSAAIAEWVQAAKDGKAARAAGVALFAGQFDPDDVAYITARAAVNHLSGSSRITSVAIEIARLLEDASASETLRKQDQKAWKRLNTKIEQCPYPNKRYILVRKALGKACVQRISWGLAEKVRLGTTLLAMCAETSGLFHLSTERRGTRTFVFMKATDGTLDWLNDAHQRCSLQAPHYLPMVTPPVPWHSLRGGGYLSKGLPLHLISTKRMNKGYAEELRHRPMPMVYDALNAIQATPWRINKGVHSVLKEVWDSGSTLGGMPAAEGVEIPVAPWGDGPAPSMDDPRAKEFYARKARAKEQNELREEHRTSMTSKVWIADDFARYERIYFPHVLDWRGRIYPVVPHLNPQGDDAAKGLLEFAEGLPLGDDGAYWLAVHGANCFDIDDKGGRRAAGLPKATFDERVEWVEANAEAILDSALDPLNGKRFWCDADMPWMFLAFCKEWAGLTMHVNNGGSYESFVSYLPVSWDGSCNGLQNFSAMLRDPLGGEATNLIPCERPSDIYQRVAEVASRQVEVDAANGEVNAAYWLGKVDRKWAKRPTMTLPYGSGKYGFRDQLRNQLQKYRHDHAGQNYLMGDEFLCSAYLANVMHDALTQVVVAARSAMDWLKEVSQVVAAEGLPIWWTTPAGFQVMQDYREAIAREIDFTAGSRRMRLDVTIYSDKLDKRKQAQGISPNFVHSLDAAHLMRTVVTAMPQGIKDFAMVHDSYGTHAGNATKLHRILREAFVEQYSANVLEDFRTQILEQVDEKHRDKVPPVPAMGTLDLEAVKDSSYFFA